MHRRPAQMLILLMAILLAVPCLFAEDGGQQAAWSSDKLSQPLAVDGRIRHSDENAYSFQLNDAGIPEEPVVFRAEIKDSIDQGTGTGENGETLYDIEKLRFQTEGFTSYIGARVLSVAPGETDYYENGTISGGSGSNIDLIKGGRAVLHLAYNPTTTHQTGAFWYCVNDPTFSDFAALPGSSDCTVYGNETTNLSGEGAGTELYQPKVIRALSIYDPWFDEMEARYGDEVRRLYEEENPDATEAQLNAVTWRSEYLKKSAQEHLYSGPDSMWRYPPEDGLTIYTDYMITVRSPIEMVTFTSSPEYAVGESTASAPTYLLFNDEKNHPSKTSVNRIWCYDTSSPDDEGPETAAFRITPDINPDYGYSFEYELVKGSAIGYLDFTELDGNVFRFVPRGTYVAGGETRVNYGEVVIKMTAKEIGFSKFFSLIYMPSDMKLVKYIGEDMEGWNSGIVIDEDTGEVIDSVSGEWDVVNYVTDSDQTRTQLYGMECIVLYPGEVFELAMVQLLDNHDGSGIKPYYITDGIPGTTNIPAVDEDGEEIEIEQQGLIRYAVSYSLAYDEDPESDPIPGIVEFERYAEVVEDFDPTVDGVTDMLSPVDQDTGQSYWYVDKDTGGYGDNAQRIVAREEGVYYLRYLITPISAGFGDADAASLSEATISGGIYLYITSPVNQGLSSVVADQIPEDIMLEIPHRISAGQRRPGKDEDGNPMPSHWYLGEDRGAIRYPVTDAAGASGDASIYMGAAYMLLSDGKPVYGRGPEGFDVTMLTPVSQVDMGDRYLEIYDGEGGVPRTPGKLSEWQGKFTIGEAKGTGTDVRNKPDIADVIITGKYGLSSYPGIRNLRIIDNAGVNGRASGLFTLVNLQSEGADNIWDMSRLDLRNYEHANMGEVGRRISEMLLPEGLVSLNLDSVDVMGNTTHRTTPVGNNLDCTFDWGSKDSMKELRVGNNRFSRLEMRGFPALQFVSADGALGFESGLDNNGRSLVIYDCPELEYVQANETYFNNLMVDFPASVPGSNLTEADASARIHTMLRADGSSQLRKVNVSGHLSYLELADNSNLVSVIGSNEFDPDDPDSYVRSPDYVGGSPAAETGWIRVVNLGGSLGANIDSAEVLGLSQDSTGDQTSWLHRNTATDDARSAMDLSAWTRTSKGSCGIQTLKLNYVYRLHSAAGGTGTQDLFNGDTVRGSGYDKSALTDLEVFAIVPDPATAGNWSTVSNGSDTHYSSGNTAGSSFPVYSFDLRHAGKTSSRILFHHVPEDVSVNLSGGGMRNIEIMDFQGFLNLYMATAIDDIRINESAAYSSGSDSLVELSRSGIRNLTGTPVFAGVNVSPLSFDMTLPANENGGHDEVSDTFTVTAFPSSFNTQLSVGATSSDPSVCSVSVGSASSDGILVTITGKSEGTAQIRVVCQSGGKSESATVSVNVQEEYVPSYTITLVGGHDEVIDGKTVRVLEYDTRNSTPLKMELEASDDIGMDASKAVFQDYDPDAPDNPFQDEYGRPMTFEDFYYQNDSSGSTGNLVSWTFEATGHSGQEFAEIVLDSYMGNRVYIRPLIDDEEYTCTVRLQNSMYNIDYEATFIVRVKGGGGDRWEVRIQPADDPLQLDRIGGSPSLTASIYDRQLLTDGQPTAISASALREPVEWSIAEASGIVDYRLSSEGANGTAVTLFALENGEGSISASYRSGQAVAERAVIVDAPDIENAKLESGAFNAYDGSGNYDNVWDINWKLDVQGLGGADYDVENASITGGTLRFTTSKGTFDFTICNGLGGDYVSFRADSCPSFTYGTIAPGMIWENYRPGESYSDTDSFIFGIQPPQAQALSLLNSGTVEIVELSFKVDGVGYTWKSASLIAEEMGPVTNSILLSARVMAAEPVAVTANEYIQSFTASSMMPAGSDMDEAEAPRLKNLSRMMAVAASADDATIVNANVTRIALNRCPNLTDITVSIDSNEVTADGLVHLEADENPALTDVFINLDSQGRLADISVTGCAKLKTFYAKAPSLKKADVSENGVLSSVTFTVECTGLEWLDLHDDALGGGSMSVGNFKYQNHSFSVGSTTDWKSSAPRLSYFAAYGNGMYHNIVNTTSENKWKEYSIRFGSDIPSSATVLSYEGRLWNWWFFAWYKYGTLGVKVNDVSIVNITSSNTGSGSGWKTYSGSFKRSSVSSIKEGQMNDIGYYSGDTRYSWAQFATFTSLKIYPFGN